jgi:hypothetical protein
VLCALPALLANGLLAKADTLLGKLRGYYTLVQVLILFALSFSLHLHPIHCQGVA